MLIPRKVRLGPGWDIQVHFVDQKIMEAAINRETAGIWDKTEKAILILRTLSKNDKWAVFCEELAHALVDRLAEMRNA